MLRSSRWIVLLFFSLATSLAQSATAGYYAGVAAGAFIPTINKTNFVENGPGWPSDRYQSSNPGASALMSLMAGYSFNKDRSWFPQIAIEARYGYALPSKVYGEIIEYDLAQYNNYTYSYGIQNQTVLALLKGAIFRYKNLVPFIVGGGGWTINQTSNYLQIPGQGIIPQTSPAFGNRKSSHGAWMLGTGLDYAITNSWLLGLEYNYADLGSADTGFGKGAYAAQRLVCNLKANTILFTMRYVFNGTQ